jgi:L-fuconolactonase
VVVAHDLASIFADRALMHESPRRSERVPRVDAHHHVWRLARGDYGWLEPSASLAPIYRDFHIDELRPLLRAAGIDATVLVQAAPTVAETRFLLDIASASAGLVKGVVGWVDFNDRDALATLSALSAHPLLKSVRPMLQDLGDPAWILRADVARVVASLPGFGLCFDALATPRELPSVATMIEQHPGLAVVIDHCAKPDVVHGGWQPWASDIARIGRQPHAYCKLSGVVTEAGAQWTVKTLRPYVDHVLHCFGAQRVMWGSDWPVLTLASTYEAWTEATDALLAELSGDERDAIRGGNATRFYGLT